MARYVALAAVRGASIDRFAVLRATVVSGCAMALILAGHPLPL